MAFTTKHLQVDFSLVTGNFQGGGNSYSASGLRIRADIVKAGGISDGAANIVIYGLPLSVMNQLCTFGQVLTTTGKNIVTVSAWEDGASPTVVFKGTITSASVDGQAQPNVGLHVEAFASALRERETRPADLAARVAGCRNADEHGRAKGRTPVRKQRRQRQDPEPVPARNSDPADACLGRSGRHRTHRGLRRHGDLAVERQPAGRRRHRVGRQSFSPQTGLVAYPQFNSQGIVFRALWNPGIQYGAKITVQSSIQPACGQWVIYKLQYALACMEPNGPWFCDISAWPPKTAPTAPVG